jgi:hypothetical protein
LPVVNPTNVPLHATFWFLSTLDTNRFGFGPPLPWNPFTTNLDAPIYYWRGNSYVVDDTGLPLEQQEQYFRTNQTETEMLFTTEDATGGGGEFGPMDADVSYPSNYLWLSIEAVSNGTVFVTAHGTVPDQTYELLSREQLTNTTWVSEGTFIGAEGQDWTPTTIAVGTRTNSLFIWSRSWADSDGDGLPDWWEMQYGLDPGSPDTGNTGIPDGYKELAGDGWTTLYKYEHGLDPRQPITPPPPRNVQARLDSTGTNVIITWESGGGPVANYGIILTNTYWGGSAQIGQVSASTFTFTNHVSPEFMSSPHNAVAYQIRAYFSNGSHADSSLARFTMSALSVEAQFIRGPNGAPYLAISAVPANLAYLRVYVPSAPLQWVDIYPTNLQNGIVPAPINDPRIYDNAYPVVAFGTNGDFGQTVYASADWMDADGSRTPLTNFVDAAVHMKENLKFLLRSATLTQPFSYVSGLSTQPNVTDSFPDWSKLPYPEFWYARPATDGSYEYYGFHSFSSNLNYSFLEELRPVRENHLWRNFVYDPDEIGPGGITNGMAMWTGFPTLRAIDYPMLHRYTGDSAGPFPLPLSTASSTDVVSGYLRSPGGFDFDEAVELGFTVTPNDGYPIYLPGSARNVFGLPISSIIVPQVAPNPPDVFPAGGSPAYSGGGFTYMNATAPGFQTVDYYFASQTPFFNFYTNILDYNANYPAPPFPGSPSFSVTNPSPLLITGIGQPITVSGWAKMAITNGYPGKYAYLEQYWDKAFKTGTNGQATTNETGLLSPYGEFFPTEPGPAALVTMPDIDTGQRGTGIVNVIKLQLDVNHDGAMDLSFAGQDNTSAARSALMWVNNDHDEPASGNQPDRDLNDWGNPPPVPPDYNYGQIRCQRNLEDFARIWICGTPTLPTNQSCTVQLGWSQINSGAPRMRLYRASETNGGIGYLTNTAIAAQQIAQNNLPIGEISPSSTLTLPANVFSNGLNKYFLYEAGGVGSGQLTLTISQGSNIIAQTSAWFDFHDIRDFYEQALVTNVLQDWPDMVQTNLTSGFHLLSPAKANSGDAKQLAVFIHGWRMSVWDWYNFSETMLKRLWWQGYQGRFAALRWPTRNANTELFPQMGFITYNRSESIAFKSGTGAAAYLNDLRNRFPDYTISGCSHSMGGIVAMQTLKELAAAGQQPLNNWVLMQAAVPAQCFDPNVPNFQMFLNGEALVPTPDVYRNYAAGITNALRHGGRIANFFNPDDFALWTWQLNQALYVTNLLGNGVTTMKPNAFFGYSTDGTNSILSTNVWNQSFYSIIYGGYYGNGPTRTITDPLELMPFVARPRSLATGAQPNVHGQIQGLLLNLETQLGFGADEGDHSGQFNRNIQEPPVWPFYSQLGTNLFVQP